MNIVLPSRERVEELIVRLQTINEESWRPGRNAWIDDVIAILRDYAENTKAGATPSLMDLRGIAPNATGDLSSEEFVRRIREGWIPPWKAPSPGPEDERALDCLDRASASAYLPDADDPELSAEYANCQAALAHLRRRLAGAVVGRDRLELEALLAERAGMDAENATRAGGGNAPAYGMDHYQEIADRIRSIGVRVEEGK